jgi:hypothetical protein
MKEYNNLTTPLTGSRLSHRRRGTLCRGQGFLRDTNFTITIKRKNNIMKKQTAPTLKVEVIQRPPLTLSPDDPTYHRLKCLDLLPPEVQELIMLDGMPYPQFKAKMLAAGVTW